MAYHADRGDTVDVIFLTDGVSSRDAADYDLTIEASHRRAAANEAAQILGANAPHFLDFPDQRLDQLGMLQIVQAIETISNEISPTVVYTHHYGDLNTDHRLASNAALTAFRPMPHCTVKAVYGFEVRSSTEWRFGLASEMFSPSRFLDISETWPRKMAALRAYHREMRGFPHSRSYEAVEAQARLRGVQVGLKAAEAFTTYWETVP
jgi:LmbE family N-acetylglucosaminyl deacetylase